jgi:hypothetical protein
MSRKTKAWVRNGNKNYYHRVFAILGGSIIKSWGTDEYLKLSRKEIEKQLEMRKTHFRATAW